MTASAIITRMYCRQKPEEAIVLKGLDLILKDVPNYEENHRDVDYYYWYHGTKALLLTGAVKRADWIKALKAILVSNQSKTGCKQGSWDLVCEWSIVGGRIYGTAMNALTLELLIEDTRKQK